MRPNSMEKDGYSKTVPIKLTSMDILESGEFKKQKINREYNFLNRSINIMNHCYTHTCSSYCLVITVIKVLYNIVKYKHVKDVHNNRKCYTLYKIENC